MDIEIQRGSMQGGDSADPDDTNIFVRNSHLLAKLQSVLKHKGKTSAAFKKLVPKFFWLLGLTLFLRWCKISSSDLVPVTN